MGSFYYHIFVLHRIKMVNHVELQLSATLQLLRIDYENLAYLSQQINSHIEDSKREKAGSDKNSQLLSDFLLDEMNKKIDTIEQLLRIMQPEEGLFNSQQQI